jgi:hypothetical protein
MLFTGYTEKNWITTIKVLEEVPDKVVSEIPHGVIVPTSELVERDFTELSSCHAKNNNSFHFNVMILYLKT